MENLNRPELYDQDPNDAGRWRHTKEHHRQIRKVRYLRASEGGAAIIIDPNSDKGEEGFRLTVAGVSSGVFESFENAACSEPKRA